MDTIFALSSGRPPAAVSVIRISGPRAHDAGRQMAGALPEARTAAVRAIRDPRSGEQLDEALVLRFDAPASSTGEDVLELQCHGGRAVVDSLLSALGSIDGLRPAEPGEFTRRAFENGRIDLTEAEGLADLIEAETEAQRKAALALSEGGLKKQIAVWQGRLLDLSAVAERAIDYDEDDELWPDPHLLAGARGLGAELRDWLCRPRIERLKDGIRVVVAGPPNSGKSSLINAIVGDDRVIVTDVPGTTRDYVDVPLSLGGIPILLTDTAGLRTTADKIEAIGVERATALVQTADILIWLGDPLAVPMHPRAVLLHAQADRADRLPVAENALAVSALTGMGIEQLLRQVVEIANRILPGEGVLALNRRQAKHVEDAAEALDQTAHAADVAIAAESLRQARGAFDRLTGTAGVEDVLDALFGRFCLGK